MPIKLKYLDGLRGWAALIVVLGHYCFVYLPYIIDKKGSPHFGFEATIHTTPWYVLVNGGFAVCIFFILSGLVLSSSFFARKAVTTVQRSAVKRYFRLAIPAGVSAILAYLLLQTGSFHNQAVADITGSGWWSQFWHNDWNLWQSLRYGFYEALTSPSGPETLNPVLWTLQVELLGSFLVYTILALFGHLPQRWIVYTIAGWWLAKTYYLSFIIGLVLADLLSLGAFNKLPSLLKKLSWLPLVIIGIVLGSMPNGSLDGTVFHFFSGWYEPSLEKLRIVIFTAGATALMLAILMSPFLQRLLSSRSSRFMGRISFSLYLTHFLALGSYSSYLFITTHLAGWPYGASIAFNLISGLLMTFVVADIFTRLVDEPSIKLSAWLHDQVLARQFTLKRQSRILTVQPAPTKNYALSYKHKV